MKLKLTKPSAGKADYCPHCGGNLAIRNPVGICDHLYYPENCKVCEGVGKAEWEKSLAIGLRNHIDDERFDNLYLYLKDFIASELAREKKRICEGMKCRIHEDQLCGGCGDCRTFHKVKALTEAAKKVRNK